MSSPTQNPSPMLEANIFSRFFHCWLSRLITKSHKQGTLHLDDLYDLPEFLESSPWIDKLEANWFDEIRRNPLNPSLIRATVRTMGWKLPLIGLLIILMESLNIILPLLLAYLMQFFEPCSTISSLQAWSAALVFILTIFGIKLLFHHSAYQTVMYSLQMRAAYSGIIHRKVLRLSSHAMNNYSSGQLTNLLANDAYKIELLHYFINYLWVAPFQIIVVVIFLWYFIKYIAFIAIGYTLFLLLIQPLLSRLFLRLRADILKVTDERVKTMSEIIKSMRIVKMYCWESAFIKKVRQIRKREMIKTTLYMMCTSIEMILSHSYIGVASLLMFGTMWSLDMRFDTRLFTISFILLTYTNQSSIFFFNFAIRDLFNYLAAEKRIRTFLLLDESERDNRLLSNSSEDVNSLKQTPQVICDLQHAQWEKNATFSLKKIVFDARPGDLICVIGPVGSGKSSLLQTLTGEISYFDGKVRLHGSFCYVPQESWIFSSTVKENILFGKEYIKKSFERVIHATALDTDLSQLSDGVNTLVGDQGVMLSGGQKARVNMARALYRDADIYLLDDPLSAVDTKVSKHLFENSIKRYLRDKICILATHQIQFLQDATKIIVLNNGEVAQMGTYEELLASSLAFARLLEDINQHKLEHQSVSHTNQPSMIGSISSDKGEEEDDMNSSPVNLETKQEGNVKRGVYISYLQAGVGIVLGPLLILIVFSVQQAIGIYSNWWLAAWSNDEGRRYQNLTHCANTSEQKHDEVYWMTDDEWKKHRDRRFYIFSVLVLALCLIITFRTILSRFIFLNAARVLHNKMFKRVIRCPISFFDTNPLGRILNRFTSDTSAMDDSLIMTVTDFLGCLSQVLGCIILVGILNPWSFIPAIIVGVGMFFLRRRFVSCSRSLKRLVGVTRSPIYSQLTTTIQGLKVIRSYHAEKISANEFVRHLDNSIRVSYLVSILNRWSAMRFDFMTLIFTVFVLLLAIVARMTHRQFSTVDIALTLIYSLRLMSLLQWTIRQSVEVETQMTSVERILEYCVLQQEPPAHLSPPHQPPTSWPTQGRIVFDHVSMSHSNLPHSPLALQNISLVIHSGEKVGIVGRTGAGKSSFIQCLFRMGTLVHGRIIIDDVDISLIGLDDVRHRISIIPQDPVLFTGTMRSNLDPFGRYSDTELWNALEQVQLKKVVRDVISNGLESVVSESGSNLSVGQKQLVCLARAILKKSRILVIDEATANVDNVTDELIQRSIRDEFKECTVLTVAHRLRTVIDSDRIMVVNDGNVVEFDVPEVLLSNDESYFASLVEQAGAAEAEYLRSLANSSEANTKRIEEISVVDEEAVTEMDETDPLVPSSKLS